MSWQEEEQLQWQEWRKKILYIDDDNNDNEESASDADEPDVPCSLHSDRYIHQCVSIVLSSILYHRRIHPSHYKMGIQMMIPNSQSHQIHVPLLCCL